MQPYDVNIDILNLEYLFRDVGIKLNSFSKERVDVILNDSPYLNWEVYREATINDNINKDILENSLMIFLIKKIYK